ncbi:MAG: hypothetical protein GQ574_03835 [Crocinitomix sp.]|nr:hypothetical protein [Crocinitomix sp.]
MRVFLIVISVGLLVCNSCYKKFNVDEELHASMLDEAYMDYYEDSWYYFSHSFYKDNSDNPYQSYLDVFFKIPHEHLSKVQNTYINVFYLNSGETSLTPVSKVADNDAVFKLRYIAPVYETNFCYSIGAYNDSTEQVINEFDGCFLFEE